MDASRNPRSLKRLSPAVPPALAAALLLMPGAGAWAQGCESTWSRPFACAVEASVLFPGERWRDLSLDRPLRLPLGASVELELRAVDQYGRQFPPDRMVFGLEPERSCGDLLEVEGEGQGRFELKAGARRGSCDLWLWVPGNLNLEWRLTAEIAGLEEGYSRAQAEIVTTRLYRAILGREPDAASLGGYVAEVQRGRLEAVVDAMFRSGEFAANRSRLTATELLESFYRGLLGRDPDSGGVRTYLGEVERRRYSSVVLRLLRSEEFEESLVRAATPVG